MNYTVLAINPGHNASIALVSNGELIFFIEEERITRCKKDGHPISTLYEFINKYNIKIDEWVIGGTNDSNENPYLSWIDDSLYKALARKLNKYQYYEHKIGSKIKEIKFTKTTHQHHLNHAQSAFYNSGFDEAVVIIIDGAGSSFSSKSHKESLAFEAETIFKASYPNNFIPIYKSVGYNRPPKITITKTYEAITRFLGWHASDGGKTMGLAPYGKFNQDLPPLLINGQGNLKVLKPHYPACALLNEINVPIYKKSSIKDFNFHYNKANLNPIQADLAWQIQHESQNAVADLIKKSIEKTKINKVCIAGGYGLNCVTNYFLKQKFPNIEFYHEPLSNDAGISIGAAWGRWYKHSQSKNKNPLKSLYLGFKYSNKEIKKSLKKYKNMFKSYKVNHSDIAKLISGRNIVTIFQGRSEAGPRALGNRSILYDPTDPNGKDFVNKVKKREWFRPFAGTVLLEKANEWFDMAGLEESPFMMYAMDVWPDKQEQIQAITHVDGTCRIQTVTKEQNPHYYKLIQEFEKITGVPILFNTSFNLAGDPLVETIEDALETMLKSEMKYMYVPELEMLLEKK